ncbi:MAG TPA: hypothetical protein DCM08_09120 [Microscillaceae bacterium]|jgi:uncharacterized lipoprotein YddW (UPF0748 family)|nr:hypothetical protein [Microscillaceae bacterium]
MKYAHQGLMAIFFLLFSLATLAQNPPPKREFRGIWVATVYGLDFPSRSGLSTEKQKQELRDMVSFYKQKGFNTLVFQVRSAADALFNSPLEPWSAVLTGTAGKAPDPLYDPLAVVIEECHARQMELHAWINPYRAVSNVEKNQLPNDHVSYLHPEWFITYDNKKLFDPGLPEVRGYLSHLIGDIARRYDVDGIHFDDYFYPYPVAGQAFADSASFAAHNPQGLALADWRRDNVDRLIAMVHDTLQAIKPHIKFGISPFGVWRNQRDDPRGSATQGGQPSYDNLYADVRKWLEQGWIDYVAPQLYWSMEHPKVGFKVLADWWAANRFGRHFYTGHAVYKIVEDKTDPSWKNPAEVPSQVRYARDIAQAEGSLFFRAKFVENNTGHLLDSLSMQLYQYPAFIPTMPWKDNQPPAIPNNYKAAANADGVGLQWAKPDDEVAYYAVYKIPVSQTLDWSNPQYLLQITTKESYFDPKGVQQEDHYYLVTAFDRLHNESMPAGKLVRRLRQPDEDTSLK